MVARGVEAALADDDGHSWEDATLNRPHGFMNLMLRGRRDAASGLASPRWRSSCWPPVGAGRSAPRVGAELLDALKRATARRYDRSAETRLVTEIETLSRRAESWAASRRSRSRIGAAPSAAGRRLDAPQRLGDRGRQGGGSSEIPLVRGRTDGGSTSPTNDARGPDAAPGREPGEIAPQAPRQHAGGGADTIR
jgi:hypothetical protein